ncbi:hybrid sensor histidine kinase/response regulator [Caenimonas sedimenti]|uniref:histidine kinase n=1 Tax=Caenimonas sedimenti TaxID=2596921 RepID=A0A562ZPQ6_9BURK|nr:hybrid sensor histidine kinase/response regulator [Caenimonas sedimenti]TWO70285.1 hybrid sensor histidine kinase/response regulator [Caenimonas sedimenti]
MSSVLDHRPDPEDGTHTPANYLIFRATDLLGALLYMTVLPWWQPFTWFCICAFTGTLRYWHATRPWFAALPQAQRRGAYRFYTWVHTGAIGGAAYFCFVSGNMLMLTLLGVHLFGAATVAALRLSADFLRNAVAVTLIIAPTALRCIAEGVMQHNTLLFLMGIGGFFMIATVVMASRFHERTLDQQFEQRRRAERAADAMAGVGLTKSRFFAAVSHDLRQPVHAIGLYLDPLVRMSAASGDKDAQRAVEGIRLSWKALDGLLSQVLDLTRMDAGVLQPRMESVDLGQVVRSLILQHSAVAERAGVRLIALAEDERYALADELMLKRVVSNLIDNAIKFSPRGGSVVVAVRRAESGWRLQVRDAGKGIPLDAQGKIFEEFVQIDNDARNRQQGYGLGLAISRRFTNLMEGSLLVRSEPGRGCCMTVLLQQATVAPNARDLASSALDTMPAPESISGAMPLEMPDTGTGLPPRDILIVEDDLLVASAMRQLLQSWGQRVTHVENAADAMSNSAKTDVAICDVRLPRGESGLDVALQLRLRGKQVLLITGETDSGLRRAATEHGLPLLVKPVSSARLLGALRELVH